MPDASATRRSKRLDVLILFGLVGLGLLLGRLQTVARNSGRTDPASAAVRLLIRPASGAIGSVANGAAGWIGAVTRSRDIEREDLRLRQAAAAGESYESDVSRLQKEVDELRGLGGWEARQGREKVPADVVGYFPHESRLTIGVGANQGVKRGMPVATYEGLLGRIETVDQTTAQVLLLTSVSSESRISAVVRKPPSQPVPAGLMRGEGPGLLALDLADPASSVTEGEVVMTSGFSDLIPRGIVIGDVISIHDDPAFGKRTAMVKPRVDIGQVHEVLVIK